MADTTNPFDTQTAPQTTSPFDVQSQVPNFWQASQLQAAGNLTGAQTATEANRANQYNPYGSLTWSQDPTTGQWSQNIAFSPDQQNLWNQYMQNAGTLGGIGGTAMQNWYNPSYGGFNPNQYSQYAQNQYLSPYQQSYGGVNPSSLYGGAYSTYQNPMFAGINPSQFGGYAANQYMNANPTAGVNLQGMTGNAAALYGGGGAGGVQPGSLGAMAAQQYGQTDRYGGISPTATGLQGVSDQMYGAATARLDPQWQKDEQTLYSRLYNQGLRPGTEAWTNAARDFNQAKNDAYSQARAQALQQGQSAQAQLFGMGQQAQQQAYGQAMGAYGAGLQGQQQGYGQLAGLYGLGQGGQQQAYNQLAGLYGMGMQGNQLGYGQLSGLYGMGLQGAQQGLASQQAGFGNLSSLYGMGLQGSNAALQQALAAQGGAVPQQPQFAQYYQQQATTGPNYLGALGEQYQGALDVYNADIAQQNAQLQGLYGLGTGILGLNTSGGGTLGGDLLSKLGGGIYDWFTGQFGGS